MRLTLESLALLHDPQAAGVDAIIDVRSPAEFADDHLPGAENLPVLSDAERAEVGRIYVQESRFVARRIGAALVARNVARHLDDALHDRPRNWQPLVYCWRGGQRSGAFSMILQQVGWPVRTLDGGYRAYRRLVVRELYERPFPSPVVLLDGNTGTAKTAVLQRLPAHGVQVIDLEALAQHRGSLFGHMEGGQPSQKAFETALALAVAGLDPTRPVVVEAESSRIGRIMVPPALWKAMQAAPRVQINAPLAARAAYLTRDYAHVTAHPERLCGRINTLRPWHSRAQIDIWQAQAQGAEFEALAAGLLAEHYDPRYRRARAEHDRAPFHVVEATALNPSDLDAAALVIAGALRVRSKIDALAGGR